MAFQDYPALYQDTDRAAIRGQKRYLWLVRGDLILVVVAAALGTLWPLVPDKGHGIVACLAAVVLIVSIIVKFIIRERKDDRAWFDGRAAAETIKSTTWRFMMRVPPFDDDTTSASVFAQELRTTLDSLRDLLLPVQPAAIPARQITPRMLEVRGLQVPERRAFYRAARTDDEARWYQSKSAVNQDAAERWFWATLVAQVIAAFFALLRVADPTTSLNVVGFFSAMAAAFTAWTQIGRHDELAKSYAVAAHELGIISELVAVAATQDELNDRVRDSEGAISREHTLWVAKRTGKLPPGASLAGR